MSLVRKLLHHWFPRRCARDAPLLWEGTELRCSICGRLLAYRYPENHNSSYAVHVCYPHVLTEADLLPSANASLPDEFADPDPYGVEATIQILRQRPIEEPLESDSWSDEPNEELENNEPKDNELEFEKPEFERMNEIT